jgi:hypothetical protein
MNFVVMELKFIAGSFGQTCPVTANAWLAILAMLKLQTGIREGSHFERIRTTIQRIISLTV